LGLRWAVQVFRGLVLEKVNIYGFAVLFWGLEHLIDEPLSGIKVKPVGRHMQEEWKERSPYLPKSQS
jgi:hypothetical protein